MNEDISDMINAERERQGLPKKDLARGLLTINEYEAFETGERLPKFWVMKCLVERLGIRNRRYTIYLGNEEFEKQNQIEQIYNDIIMNRLVSADKGLTYLKRLLGDDLYDKVYYVRLMLFYENRIGKFDYSLESDVITYISNIKEALYKNKLLSLEELALLSEYVVHEEKEKESKKKDLFNILVYIKRTTERIYQKSDVFSELIFYYGRILFEEKDYLGCIKVCEEGLMVTKTTKKVSFSAELYELIAYSNQKLDRNNLYEQQINKARLIRSFFYTEESDMKGELHGLLQHCRDIN